MDKYEISYLLGERYCDLIETSRRHKELKKLYENDDDKAYANMENEIEIMKVKVQIMELKKICKILDLDWKLVRQKAVEKFEIEL